MVLEKIMNIHFRAQYELEDISYSRAIDGFYCGSLSGSRFMDLGTSTSVSRNRKKLLVCKSYTGSGTADMEHSWSRRKCDMKP